MSIFLIIGLSLIAWFVFGWFAVRLYIIDTGNFDDFVGWLFILGPLSWLFGMCVTVRRGVRARAHFLPVIPMPDKNLRARMFGINLEEVQRKRDAK